MITDIQEQGFNEGLEKGEERGLSAEQIKFSGFRDINILIPNYNNGKYLNKCLSSIFSQNITYSFLVIIVDDASTDNSIDIIKEYYKKYPDNIYLISNEKNFGLLETTFNLYKKINSLYFTVLDSDDKWINNNFLETSIKYLNNNSQIMSYSNNTRICYENENKNKIRHAMYCHPCIIKTGYDKTNDVMIASHNPHTSGCVFRSTVSKKMIDLMTIILSNKKNNDNFLNQLYCQLYEGDTFRNWATWSYGQTYHDYTVITGFYRIKVIKDYSRWSSLDEYIKTLLHFLFYIEMYFKLTDNNTIKKYILKNKIQPIDKVLKSIRLNNMNLVSYNNTKYSIIEYNKALTHAVHIYNLLPERPNDKSNKHFLFFLPSKIIGGLELLFVNLAVDLSNIGYKVSYIDYENGHLNKIIGLNNKIHLIPFPDNHPYQHTLNGSNFVIESNDDVNLIIPLTMSLEVKVNLSKQSKIMYYMAHPKSVKFLEYRSCTTRKNVTDHLNLVKKNICCQDETNLMALKKNTGFEHKIIPIYVNQTKISYCQKHNIKKECEINIGYIGRLDCDKIFSLINVLDNLSLYNTSFKKNVHIIGCGDRKHLITNNKSYEDANINIIFTGFLLDNDKYDYLYNNVDILFSMGTSSLDGALVKIPSVLILSQVGYKLIDDKFIYLHNLKRINNRFYEEDIHNMGSFMFNNFSNIMDDIYKSNKISEIGEKCFEYCINNHEVNNTLINIIEYFNY